MPELLRQCLHLLDRRARWQALLVALLIPVGSLAEVVSLALIVPFIQLVSSPSKVQEIPILAQLHQALGMPDINLFLMLLSAGLVAVFGTKNLLLIGLIYVQGRFVYLHEARLACALHRGYLRSPYVLHLDRNSAELIRNIDGAVSVTFSHVLMGFLELLAELVVVVAVIGLLIAIEPMVALAAFAGLGSLTAGFYFLFRRRYTSLGAEAITLSRDTLASLQQSLGSVKEIKVLGREAFFEDAFADIRSAAGTNRQVTAVFGNIPRLFVEFVMVFGLLLVVIVILSQGRPVAESIPVLGLFAIAAFRLLPSANRILSSLHRIRYGASAVAEIFADASAHSRWLAAAPPAPEAGSEPELGGDVRLEGVGFRYPGSDRKVLDDITLVFRKGTSTGLIGASGAGKTTLADLVLGLLVPTRGRIRIGGRDAMEALAAWRHRVGYVPQNIFLLDDTLRANIAFGIPKDRIDEQRLRHAIGLARLDSLVEQLPLGLDTVTGERGVRLSGGQRQRIGIARALYHDPEILVLDEATSALDNETELEISRSIECLKGVKTLLIIAHRLNTVRRCDQLVFLAAGRVVDQGTFEELESRDEGFRRLVTIADLRNPDAALGGPHESQPQ